MQIQTKRARDTPEKSIVREGIETQKVRHGVDNRYRIKQKRRIKRSYEGKKPVLKLSRKKYLTAKGDEENPNNITTVQSTLNVAGGVTQAGGVIRTAVGGTRNTAGRIQTAIKNGVRVGTVKDVGKVIGGAGAAMGGVMSNAAKESGRSLLKTKIDKTTTTDTGTEAIKQGLTDIRYVDNARKAIYNTAQGGIKTARSVKETPKAVGRDVRKIREKIIRNNRSKQAKKAKKNAKTAGAAAERSVSVISKAVTSKGFWIVAGGGAVIIIFMNLINGFMSMILTTIASMFSWMDPKDPNVDKYKFLQAYHVQVQEAEASLQTALDEIFVYTPEYRYDDTEITSLYQYGNTKISVDENAVIAAAAVIEFQNGNDKLSDETIMDMTKKFYEYWQNTETGCCPDSDCMKDDNVELTAANGDFYVSNTAYIASSNEYAVSFRGTCYEHTSSVWTDLTIATSDGSITGTAYAGVSGSDWEVTYNIGAEGFNKINWEDITIKTTTIYCNKSDHTIYKGEVTNYDAETALSKLGFNKDQTNLFWTYYYALEAGGI